MNIIEKQKELWEIIKSQCIARNNYFFIVGGRMTLLLTDLQEFKAVGSRVPLDPLEKSSPYLIGSIEGIKVYVDPLIIWSDLRARLLDNVTIDLSDIINSSDLRKMC